jgi:type 1 glutamine amidotransferase
VLKDVQEPSAAINPDQVAYNIELKNGEAMTGVLVGDSGTESKFADASGKITALAKNEIASMKPSAVSLMPEGLLNSLSEAQRKDLFTFLLMPSPLEPAPISIKGEPPPRSRAEIDDVLKATAVSIESAKRPLHIVLCSGPKDHGQNEHDYPLWLARWSKLFSLADNVTVETALEWPSAKALSSADVIVFYSNNPGWSPGRATELDQYLNRGGGLVYLHYAVDGHDHVEELAQRIGLAWRGGGSKFRHGPLDLDLHPHPITAGMTRPHFVDESYWQLIGDPANIQPVADGIEEDKPQPLMWTREQGRGRVFVSIPGHYTWTFDDPLFRVLIFRGMAWSAHAPLNTFDDLVTIGTKVVE